MTRRFSTVAEIINALSAGRVAIVVDSESRENEGDFLVAAEKVTPELIYFMVRRGCGQLCVPVAREIAIRLQLERIGNNINVASTAFAVPLDHRSCRTGICPEERVLTIQEMLNPFSQPGDFERPGHVFPLIARDGGVLRRPGHTEAAVDLTRLAGLAPAGVLCEVCSQDGRHMADRAELWEIAEEFDLPLFAIDDLIRYRLLDRDEEAMAKPLLPVAAV